MKRDSGTVFICNLIDASENGNMPKRVLDIVGKHWFEARTVGYGRYYAAMGVNEQVDMLIRIPFDKTVRIGMYAVLGNGEQFRISNVQLLTDDNNLRCVDLTLARLDSNYDVNE